MKTFFASLAVALALTLASTASAAVFVHAGPVNVVVGGRPNFNHPPVVVHPIPVPAPVFGVPGAGSPGRITQREWREIRGEAQDLQREIRQAGAHVSPREWREIRDEAQDLQRAMRQAVRY
jgi:hypothetical protein